MFKPKMYSESIYTINYDKLKDSGINVLIFDLDNTIAKIDETKPSENLTKLFKSLNKNFELYILSNNTDKKRLESFAKPIKINYVLGALKPSRRGLRKIQAKKNYSKEEMALIGDQIMTDMIAGNRFGIKTILVDQLAKKDLKVTFINRIFENIVLKSLEKKNSFKKGAYYDE